MSNVTNCEIRAITHFDNNVENVLTSIVELKETVIKPKKLEDKNEILKVTQEMLKLICTGTATTTLQQSFKEARQVVYNTYSKDEVEVGAFQEEVLVEDKKDFFDFIEQDWEDYEIALESLAEYMGLLYQVYEYSLWNSLHLVIFGADAYRSHKQQKDYLLNKLIKPYSMSVEAVFCRIDVLTSLLSHFPPTSNRDKPATIEQWEKAPPPKKRKSRLT